MSRRRKGEIKEGRKKNEQTEERRIRKRKEE
jgi:hypothetical protein